MLLFYKTVVFLTCLFYLVHSSQITIEESSVEDLVRLQSNEDNSSFHCPSDVEAVRSCKPYTLFTYTTCCLNDDTNCCFHMKEWVWIAGGVAVAIIGAVALTCLARCVFRFKNKSQQSYDFA